MPGSGEADPITTTDLLIRLAERRDLPAIVAMHAEDPHSRRGDGWTPEAAPLYERAYAHLAAHPDHDLYVVERNGAVVGTFLLSLLPGLVGRGKIHAELRSVQVRADCRSAGIGAAMVAAAEAEARARGASELTLTSNLSRERAHRFYERLGFARTHAGFRKAL